MSETVITQLTAVSKNEVSDEEVDRLMAANDYDSFEEYARSMAKDLETVVAERVFGEADEVPIMHINVEVEE